MKRSEINNIIKEARDFFTMQKFFLPEWSSWELSNWKSSYENCAEIIENKLGWDITDFGGGNFTHRGLVLFTIRNGNWEKKYKIYCEKIMIAGENQETPLHFHSNKTEDIINRGGGNLVIELFRSAYDGGLSDKPVEVKIDSIKYTAKAGETLVLYPGQSICLTPGVYHRFYGQEGKGNVLIGEVSSVNDDEHDNHFYNEVGRFPAIEEDCNPTYLLVSDYEKFI